MNPQPDTCAQMLEKAVQQYLLWMMENDYADSTIYHTERLLKHFQVFVHDQELTWDRVFTYEAVQEFESAFHLYFAGTSVRGLARYLFAHSQITARIVKTQSQLPDVYEDYLRSYEASGHTYRPSFGAIRNVLRALDSYLKEHGISLPHLKIEHVDAFVHKYSHTYQPATRRYLRSYLRGFFKYLYYDRKILTRDLASLVVGAVHFANQLPPKFLQPREVRKLFSLLAAGGGGDLRSAAMVHLGYTLGLRPKEIASISLDDVGFADLLIRIPNRKSANPVQLPLPEATIKVIAAYVIGARPKSDHRALFLTHFPPYRPVSAATVSREVTEVVQKIHPGATAYWLRHTYAQNLLESGASIFEVKEMMGHDNIQSTRRYLCVHTEMMRKVLFDETL